LPLAPHGGLDPPSLVLNGQNVARCTVAVLFRGFLGFEILVFFVVPLRGQEKVVILPAENQSYVFRTFGEVIAGYD